jgi:hypothetical protein
MDDVDPVREAEQEAHVVLDDHQRHLALQLGDELEQTRSAVRAQSGRRLIEKQDPRLRGEGQADLQRAPLAIREVARTNPLTPVQSHPLQDRRRAFMRIAIARAVAPRVERPRPHHR